MVKKALVCGLNYPNSKHQLYGCVNDSLNWVAVLEKHFQFEDVRVLIDQNPDGSLTTYPTQIPTKHNILAQLGWLCSGVRQGDMIVFVFAGHGTQVNTGNQYVDEALVPEDFGEEDEHGNPTLVLDDELHALFKRLPSGSFLTAILDCCHGTHMLDVPSFIECGKVHNSRSRPLEVTKRLEHAWKKNPHAYARPRFIEPVVWKGPRHRRTDEGSGQHLGRMNLDPGVTAFCFAACGMGETALDANIKAQQQGTMSFCLQEALAALHNTCTYERLMEKACELADDIRSKYMPTMDQNFHLSFCPNGPPSEVVVLDDRYATVSQHRLSQQLVSSQPQQNERENGRRQQQPQSQQQQVPENARHEMQRSPSQEPERQPQHVARAASSDFIPSPMHSHRRGQEPPRQEPRSPDKRQAEPRSPMPRQEARSPVPDAAPGFDLAALGMGPLSVPSLGGSNQAFPVNGSYTQQLPMGNSPLPDRNLFGMPNLFSGFGGGGGSGIASVPEEPTPTPAAGNLFDNLLGGASNLFSGAGAQRAAAPQSSPFASHQPTGGAFSSHQAFSSQLPVGGGFQPTGLAAGAYSSQLPAAGVFSSQQPALGAFASALGSQQGAFGSHASSQVQGASMYPGPARTPSGFGATLGNTLNLGNSQQSSAPHVNAYASGQAFASGAFASGLGGAPITAAATYPPQRYF